MDREAAASLRTQDRILLPGQGRATRQATNSLSFDDTSSMIGVSLRVSLCGLKRNFWLPTQARAEPLTKRKTGRFSGVRPHDFLPTQAGHQLPCLTLYGRASHWCFLPHCQVSLVLLFVYFSDRHLPPRSFAILRISSIVSFRLPAQAGHQFPCLMLFGRASHWCFSLHCQVNLVASLVYFFDKHLPPRCSAILCISSIEGLRRMQTQARHQLPRLTPFGQASHRCFSLHCQVNLVASLVYFFDKHLPPRCSAILCISSMVIFCMGSAIQHRYLLPFGASIVLVA